MQTFKIMVLGPWGSGKTVFLGSMYHRLQIQEEDIGFFLDTDFLQQRRLNSIYTQIANSKGEWPDATQYSNIEEWNFTCRTKAARGVYDAFQFSYFDYAGERLTSVRHDDTFSKEFEKALREANTYLALLDGLKILELMLGAQGNDELVDEFVRTDLTNLLPIMQRAIKPIHFVITKWDLLESKYKLSEIRDRLLEIPQFEAFVKTNTKHDLIRLIPVSSVGSGFADLQDGKMQKRAGAFPRPFQLEMALACVLLDNFRTRLAELDEEYKAKKGLFRIVKPKISILKILEIGTKRAVHSLLRNFPEIREMFGFVDEKTLEEILNFLMEDIAFLNLGIQKRREEAERRSEELNAQQQHSLDAVENERTAVKHVIESFMALQARLEKQFPESILQEGKRL